MNIGKLEIREGHGRHITPHIGIHIDWTSTMIWVYFPYLTVYIFWNVLGKRSWHDKPYVNDYYVKKGSIGKYNILKHYQPYDRDGYFNLGFDNKRIFFWHYHITKLPPMSREMTIKLTEKHKYWWTRTRTEKGLCLKCIHNEPNKHMEWCSVK